MLTVATIAALGGVSLGLLLRSQPNVLPKQGLGLLQREQGFPDRSWPGESAAELETQSEPLWFDAPRSTGSGADSDGTGSYDVPEYYTEGEAEAGWESDSALTTESGWQDSDTEPVMESEASGYTDDAAQDTWQSFPGEEGRTEAGQSEPIAPAPATDSGSSFSGADQSEGSAIDNMSLPANPPPPPPVVLDSSSEAE